LSPKWKTTTLLNGCPCTALGGVRAPAFSAASATAKLAVLALAAAPPASVTETLKVAPFSSSA
jgi:hypothetical protein